MSDTQPIPGARQFRQRALDALISLMPSHSLDDLAGGLRLLSGDLRRLQREVGLRQLSLAAELLIRAHTSNPNPNPQS